jgi:hypothetical protein
VFGWKGDSLQKAMNAKCNGDTCAQLTRQTAEQAEKCTIDQTVKESVEGCKCFMAAESEYANSFSN